MKRYYRVILGYKEAYADSLGRGGYQGKTVSMSDPFELKIFFPLGDPNGVRTISPSVRLSQKEFGTPIPTVD